MRNNCEVAVYINHCAAIRDGIVFYISENQVILTAGIHAAIPPIHITATLNLSTGNRSTYQNGKLTSPLFINNKCKGWGMPNLSSTTAPETPKSRWEKKRRRTQPDHPDGAEVDRMLEALHEMGLYTHRADRGTSIANCATDTADDAHRADSLADYEDTGYGLGHRYSTEHAEYTNALSGLPGHKSTQNHGAAEGLVR